LPDEKTREELLRISLQGVSLADDINLKVLATRMNGYSGADITSVCRDAAMMPMRRRIQGLSADEIKQLARAELSSPVSLEDFDSALQKTQSSVSIEDIKRHEAWLDEFGSI
jgi:katanin p60 ATPase-containing subunit A1